MYSCFGCFGFLVRYCSSYFCTDDSKHMRNEKSEFDARVQVIGKIIVYCYYRITLFICYMSQFEHRLHQLHETIVQRVEHIVDSSDEILQCFEREREREVLTRKVICLRRCWVIQWPVEFTQSVDADNNRTILVCYRGITYNIYIYVGVLWLLSGNVFLT